MSNDYSAVDPGPTETLGERMDRLRIEQAKAEQRVTELEAENEHLRLRASQYRVALHNHATDPDHPCSACREMLRER